ncbi:MAG: MotA/TolQ/ExbB proton channel family protein [Oligoflexia bacterium]|nr:MotA/TolQ/ExbB proton channel family protein [Oligoflexia bacterium]
MAILQALSTLIEHGGFATYLIFMAGTTLLVIGTERLLTLFLRMSFNVEGPIEAIRSLILEKKYTDALQICNKQPGAPELAVIKSGLTAVENGREAMKSALGGAVLEITHRCENRVGYLALIANVATLLGLLGTISGLIKTFASIANADAAEKAKMLGMGISEAMYATAAGLGVGILAMVVHTVCTSKGDTIVGNAQDTGLKLITWVEQSERISKT